MPSTPDGSAACDEDDKPTAQYGALARASALLAGDPEWWKVTRWVPGQPEETTRRWPRHTC